MSTRKAGVSFARWILYTWRALERLIFWKSLLIITGSRVKIISTAYAPTERTLVMDRWWAEEFLDGVNGWQQRVKSDDYCERWKGLLKSGEDNLSSREKTVNSNSSEKTGALQSVYSIVNGADDRSCWEASYSMLWWSWILSDDRWDDGRDDLAHHYPTDTSTFSISVKFRQPPANDLEMLVYGVFSETLSMNQSRQVVTTLNI